VGNYPVLVLHEQNQTFKLANKPAILVVGLLTTSPLYVMYEITIRIFFFCWFYFMGGQKGKFKARLKSIWANWISVVWCE
jgi:hypothetical protein